MTRPWRRALVAALASLLVGCGVQPQDRPEQVPPERLPTPSPTATSEAQDGTDRIWGSRDGQLVPVFVQLGERGDVRTRLDALLSLAHSGEDPPTVIPAGTRILRADLVGSTCVVDLSDHVRSAPSRDLPLLIAQLVLTATEVPGVERVEVREGGRTVPFLSSEGRPVERPLTRDDVAPLAVAGSLKR